MFQPTKVNADLGQKIHQHLMSLGLETPLAPNQFSTMVDDERVAFIESKMTDVMLALGLNLTDDSLIDTPKRIAKMFVYEKFWGLKPENFPKCTVIDNKMNYDEMVTEKNITVLSDCEHHFVQIDGKAHVSYIPNAKVLGLSKLNRVVEYFSRRPQVQERLTQQIGEALKYILGTDDVAVVINAKHYCVISRGVEDHGSETVTSYLSGRYRESPDTRAEFFRTCQG
jgi:GTP cyclohydrolase I